MTTKRKYPGPDKAPYHKGSLQEWAGYGFGTDEDWRGTEDKEWRDNTPFQASLTLTHTERGRSAMRFMWTDLEGHTFPMFATDMAALAMTKDGVAGGVATGQWVVMKRGANYGIARYEA